MGTYMLLIISISDEILNGITSMTLNDLEL